MTAITLESLKAKARGIEANLPPNSDMRVRRTLSWLERAQQEVEDPYAALVFHWIAFEAAYTQCPESDQPQKGGVKDFFERLIDADEGDLIRGHMSEDVSIAILELVANPYVYGPFWDYYNGRFESADDWQERLVSEVERVSRCIEDGDFSKPLAVAFERLSVVRAQLMHGDVTWGRNVNRSQIEDGAEILAALVPPLIHVMLDNPEMLDFPSPYPSVEMDTATIVADVRDYSIAVNIVRRVREGKERTYSSAELRKELGLDD